MRIKATINRLNFDAKGAQDDFLGALYHVMLRAAEQFLEVAAPRVPIDTGMARGSFLNLMHLLNANGYGHGALIPDEPQRVLKSGKPLKYYHVRVGRVHGKKVAVYSSRAMPKTPATAMQLSTSIDSILTLKGKEWVFQYETRVAHFNINEYGRSWQAFRLGREAMAAFLQSNEVVKMLPNLSDYVSVTGIDSGRHNPYSDLKTSFRKKVTNG